MSIDNSKKQVYELEQQLELAEIVVKLSSSHMWATFAEGTVKEAIKMKRAIESEIKREKNVLKTKEGELL